MGVRKWQNLICFNTQPPEGGWQNPKSEGCGKNSFNTQPPEGGWGKSAEYNV